MTTGPGRGPTLTVSTIDVGLCVDAGQQIASRARDPHRIFGGRNAIRLGGDIRFGHRSIGRGIDPGDDALRVGHYPDAAAGDSDTAVGIGDRHRRRRRRRCRS